MASIIQTKGKIVKAMSSDRFLLFLLLVNCSASANSQGHYVNLPSENFSPYSSSSFIPLEPIIGRSKLKDGINKLALFPSWLRGYNKNALPKNNGTPTVAYFHVSVLNINNINEESMTFEAEIQVSQSWQDARLGINESDEGAVDIDAINDIWRPEFFFKNAKSVKFHEMPVPNHYLWLYPNKTFLYMSRFSLVLTCPMDFRKFPHDKQICYLDMESLTHATTKLVFEWNHYSPLYVYTHNIELPQFEIEKSEAQDCTLEYTTGNVTCLNVSFEFGRRQGYYLSIHTSHPFYLLP